MKRGDLLRVEGWSKEDRGTTSKISPLVPFRKKHKISRLAMPLEMTCDYIKHGDASLGRSVPKNNDRLP